MVNETTTPTRGRYRKSRRLTHPLAVAFAFVVGVVLLIGACSADEPATETEDRRTLGPVAQEAEPEAEPVVTEPEPEPEVVEEAEAGTVLQQNALRSAEQYLDYTAFSRSGLIGQLEYEGFSTDDATWAVDNVTVDWDKQAAKSAQQYLDYTSFSRSGLIEQLEYEGFTTEQAEYGVNQTGL